LEKQLEIVALIDDMLGSSPFTNDEELEKATRTIIKEVATIYHMTTEMIKNMWEKFKKRKSVLYGRPRLKGRTGGLRRITPRPKIINSNEAKVSDQEILALQSLGLSINKIREKTHAGYSRIKRVIESGVARVVNPKTDRESLIVADMMKGMGFYTLNKKYGIGETKYHNLKKHYAVPRSISIFEGTVRNPDTGRAKLTMGNAHGRARFIHGRVVLKHRQIGSKKTKMTFYKKPARQR